MPDFLDIFVNIIEKEGSTKFDGGYCGSGKNRKSLDFYVGSCEKDWKACYGFGFPELCNTFEQNVTVSFEYYLAVFHVISIVSGA